MTSESPLIQQILTETLKICREKGSYRGLPPECAADPHGELMGTFQAPHPEVLGQ